MQGLMHRRSGPLSSFRSAPILHKQPSPMDFGTTIRDNEDARKIVWRFRLTENKSVSYTIIFERPENGAVRRSTTAGIYTPDNFLKEFPFLDIEKPDEIHQFVYMPLNR